MQTKEIQGRLWSKAPDYWSKYFEPYFVPLYKKALQEINIQPGDALLDAGCGSGLFSAMAISSCVQLTGIDAAPGLLELARKRNAGYSFMEEDLEALPFASESFHFVAAFNSLQYAGNFSNALAEAKRVLLKGGKLIIGIWDKPELSEATNILKAIGSLLPPPPPGTPGPFALSEDGKIEAICAAAGMRVITKAQVPCSFYYENLDHAVKSFLGTGPAAAAVDYVSEKEVQEKIAGAFTPYHLTDGMYHLQNSFLLFKIEK